MMAMVLVAELKQKSTAGVDAKPCECLFIYYFFAFFFIEINYCVL